MRIGELAARAGVNPKTIRFYEDKGVLPAAVRRPSGYRDYGEQDASRLSFIRTAQRLGLSLAVIGEILAFKERGELPCNYVLTVLDAQVAGIDRRLGELVALRAELTALKERAGTLPAESGCRCTILEHGQGPGRATHASAAPRVAAARKPGTSRAG